VASTKRLLHALNKVVKRYPRSTYVLNTDPPEIKFYDEDGVHQVTIDHGAQMFWRNEKLP
jgi:hypothetical protein